MSTFLKEMDTSKKSIEEVFKHKTRKGVDEAITEFCNTTERDHELIKKKFFDLFGVIPLHNVFFKTEGFKNMSVYRMRSVMEVGDNKDITQFGYPPPAVKKFGRANWKGRNVFYGSDTPLTCIRESKSMGEGKEFYISQWRFKEDKLIDEKYRFCSMAMDNLSESNPWKQVVKSQKDLYRHLKKTHHVSHKIADAISYCAHRLSIKFAQVEEKDYHISAFLADSIIYNPIDSVTLPLIFPSVEQEFNSCNFAFHPSFVDEYLYLDKIIKIKITNDKEMKAEYSDIGVSLTNKEIQWYNVEFRSDDLKYEINSIKCNCGKELDLFDTDKLTLNKGDRILSRDEIIAEISCAIDLKKLYNLGDILEEKGLGQPHDLRTTIGNTGLSKIINDVEYHDLSIDLAIRQIITYVPI